MSSELLKKARRHYKACRFKEVIDLLQTEIFQKRDDWEFYYLLGFSCLRIGDLGGAETYLHRCWQLNGQNESVREAMALVQMRKRNVQKAITLWLDILDENPKNTKAKTALDKLRKNMDDLRYSRYLKSRDFKKLIPGPRKTPKILLLSLFLILCAAGGIFFAVNFIKFNFRDIFTVKLNSGEEKAISLLDNIIPENEKKIREQKEKQEIVWTEQGPDPFASQVFQFTEEEVLGILQKADSAFRAGNDNQVRFLLNHILFSDAPKGLKEKAMYVYSFLKASDFTDKDVNFNYAEMVRTPLKYYTCYVRWQGVIKQLKIKEKEITFNFYIGYQDEIIFDGVIPVIIQSTKVIDSAPSLKNGVPIRLLGQVQFNKGKPVLIGKKLYRIFE